MAIEIACTVTATKGRKPEYSPKLCIFVKINPFMEFKYNIRGHLFPYEIIETNLDEFEREFVDNFEENSTRKEIFERYLNYLDVLQEICKEDFIQWIDGSFVATKSNPNDIDLVSIIPFEIY